MAVGDPHLVRPDRGWPVGDAENGGSVSGVHPRLRRGLGRRAGSAPPSPAPEASAAGGESGEEHDDARPSPGPGANGPVSRFGRSPTGVRGDVKLDPSAEETRLALVVGLAV